MLAGLLIAALKQAEFNAALAAHTADTKLAAVINNRNAVPHWVPLTCLLGLIVLQGDTNKVVFAV